MNPNPAPQWSPMASGPEDDFANFLEFSDIDFSNFGDSSSGTPQENGDLHHNGDPGGAGPMDTSMEGAASVAVAGIMSHDIQQSAMAHTLNGFQEPFPDMNASAEFLGQHSQQHQQMQMQQHTRYYSHDAVPPTPNSLEMHGTHPDYYHPADRQQQLMYDHYRRHQNEQMIFTPLVSPAVTPLDTQFQSSDYAASADCFSPLTSPALRAQNHGSQRSVYGAVRGSDTSDTTSPIDPQLEYSAPTSGQTPASLRKSKRQSSISSAKNPSRAVRQSPVVKAQSRRKQPSSTTIPPKEVDNLIEEARKARPNGAPVSPGRLPLPYSQDSSGADSVSPEPLSEILMPPPATPKSNFTSKSPYLIAKNGGGQQQPSPGIAAKEAPATPASLMKIRKGQGQNVSSLPRTTSNLKEQALLAEADMEQIMEDIALPEPAGASQKPALQPISIPAPNDHRLNPNSISKTPTAASAPGTATGSAFPSPMASALTSPNGTMNGMRNGTPKIKIRDAKKRGNSSTQISPALRPKISPSIKPLLPEGATMASPDASALLLASKSNYQNILEGTHLPGVSYPETLSTNLTSKRTSHKIAEQGRRNRINTALQEIAALLPPQTPPTGPQNGTGGQAGLMMTGSAAQQSNSKASTVELAIEYIKSLQGQLKSSEDKIKELEDKVAKSEGQRPTLNGDALVNAEKAAT